MADAVKNVCQSFARADPSLARDSWWAGNLLVVPTTPNSKIVMIPQTYTRKQIADGLKKAACSYLLKKGYACHLELGLCTRGRLKADVLAVTLKGTLCVVEVKSCLQDFKTDHNASKWKSYLHYTNQLYFAVLPDLFEKLQPYLSDFKSVGAGVLVLQKDGYLKCKLPAKYRPMSGSIKKSVVLRLAWRSGDVSKRNSRRTRVYLGQ